MAIRFDGWGGRLPLLAATVVFAGLSLANLRAGAENWVVTTRVARGQLVTAEDARPVATVTSAPPLKGERAAVTLVPGQTLVSQDLTRSVYSADAEMTLPMSGAAAMNLAAGDVVQLAEVSHGGVWLSPPLEVVGDDGGSLTTGTSTVTVAAPLPVLRAILPHVGTAWVILDPPGARS
jgi:hypothetical protein